MSVPLIEGVPSSGPSRVLQELAGTDDPTSPFVTREWLVTNGLGGYASGTVANIATRRFHAWLVAALPAPLGRTMMLAHAGEVVRHGADLAVQLGVQSLTTTGGSPLPVAPLSVFRLEFGLPVWRYDALGAVIERRLSMPHQQNTVHVSYELLTQGEVRLEIEPWIRFRPHGGALDAPASGPYALTVVDDRYAVSAEGYPSLRMYIDHDSNAFTIDKKRVRDVHYHAELVRGYDSMGELYSPGFFRFTLSKGKMATFVASTETWQVIDALPPALARTAESERRTRLLAAALPTLRDGLGADLVLAADQFVITPAGRVEDAARVHAKGDEVRTIIAGYPWFTDWGRDTMIGLEGLTLVTGRSAEAGNILRTFADYVQCGLIPNLFPEQGNDGLYHTADATLWFFHALDRYLAYTQDRATLTLLLPKLIDIIERHIAGTRYSIHVDPADGLLSQGAEGYALTWMDAKVGDLVVTPRRGKAVEINALWYNALRLLVSWIDQERGTGRAQRYAELADQAQASFNRRFWYEGRGYLRDLVDGEHGDDESFRPNQILAVALPHPILDPTRWERVVSEVHRQLWTPFGLRTLAQGHPEYQVKYFGDLRARDLAYHQGTVWAWLIGPFIDAWLRVGGDRATARGMLEGFAAHLTEAGVGSISEIFDAEAPFLPRGCIAQAWSVAEVLRGLVKTSA